MFIARASVIVLVLVAAAGCLADEEGADDGAGEGNATLEPLDLAWGLADCQATVVFFDVDGSQVAPHLPEGFAPRPIAQGLADGGPNPTGDGSFGIEMFACASGQGLGGTVEPIVYGSYFAFVDPPDDLEHDVDYHFVKWDTLVPDEPRRMLLQQHGLPVRNGTAAYDGFDLMQSLGSTDGSMDLGGAHAFTGTALVPGPPSVSFVEFMEGDGTLVAWRTQASLSASGQGSATVDIPDGNLAAEVLGAGSQDGNLLQFEGAFEGGSIQTIQ